MKAVQYLFQRNGRGALFMEMRLGKSLAAIRYLKAVGAKRILVLAPYSALTDWADELAAEKQTRFKLYTFEPSKRFDTLDSLKSYTGWFLINKESHLYIDLFSIQWDAVIMDEPWATNPKAQISKYLMKFCDTKYRIYLTGTPAPESELQYFCPLFTVDPSILGFKSFWDFRIRNFRLENFKWIPTCIGRKRINEAIARNCFSLKRADVGMDIPRIYKKRILRLPPAIRKKYDYLETNCLDETGTILKWNGQKRDALFRITGGVDADGKVLNDIKLKELKYLLSTELAGQQVIIWAWYQSEIDFLCDNIKDSDSIDGRTPQRLRDGIIKDFKNKGIRVLVLQPEVFKFGKNLVGADAVVFYSQPSGAMARQQCEARSEDVTNKTPTLIIDLLIEDTVDEDMHTSLLDKESNTRMNERLIHGIKMRFTRNI